MSFAIPYYLLTILTQKKLTISAYYAEVISLNKRF